MKKALYLLLYITTALIGVSCKSDDPEPASTPGVLESFISNNVSIKVSQVKDYYVSRYQSDYITHRGYYIVPSKDIKISALGCKVPEKGSYEIILCSGVPFDFVSGNYIYSDQINITNENEFQFKKVDQEIILLANQKYLLVYNTKNPLFYYEAKYVTDNWASNADHILLPHTIHDVQVTESFYMYASYRNDGNHYFDTGGTSTWGAFTLSGLVDLKYEVVE
ncbi:hypothetical protein [Pontibacter rugosus]|uniref:DKNYY family protein n=1 Tax=Pontibacter rugosus TaxID=1745966 RepID=A0ABW3SRF6_9BACT